MGIFSGLFRFRDKPTNRTAGSGYRYTEEGGKEKAIDHPLYLLLHDELNPEMSSFVFWEALMTHLLLWDNAYAQVIRNSMGEVIALYPLMPNKMKVNRDMLPDARGDS